MVGKGARGWKVWVAALLCVSPAYRAAVAQVGAPSAQSSAPATEITLDAATLQRYVGHYRVGDPDVQAVMTVTLSGTQLSTQLTGQPAVEVYPQTPSHFFLKVVEANLDFVTTGKGPATALVLHQNGQNVTMPRMDEAAAAQFNANLAARIKANTPQPGTQAALSDWLSRVQKGQPPDYDKMSPQLAEAMKANGDAIASGISSLGALKSLTFQSVAPMGVDVYRAQFVSGALTVLIAVDAKGVMTTLFMQPAQ